MSEQGNNGNPPEDNTKTFTQDEVNKIISERLARERAKGDDPLETREKELTARENALKCREYLAEKGHPPALLDIFDTGDDEQFKGKVDKLFAAFPNLNAESKPAPIDGIRPAPVGQHPLTKGDAIAEAFKRKDV